MATAELDIIIRDATEEDMTSVHEIFKHVLLNSTATFEEEPLTLETWVDIFRYKKSHDVPFIVAEYKGATIGYANYGPFRKASGYNKTVELTIHISEKFRGQGIGKKLMKELIRRAESHGVRNMITAVDAENTTSIILHERFGFAKVGELKNVARKFSIDLSLVLLQKSLSEKN